MTLGKPGCIVDLRVLLYFSRSFKSISLFLLLVNCVLNLYPPLLPLHILLFFVIKTCKKKQKLCVLLAPSTKDPLLKRAKRERNTKVKKKACDTLLGTREHPKNKRKRVSQCDQQKLSSHIWWLQRWIASQSNRSQVFESEN